MVDDEELEQELDGDPCEYKRVRKESYAEQGFPVRAAREDICDLCDDDRGETGRGGLHIQVVRGRKHDTPRPSALPEHPEKTEHAGRGFDGPEEQVCPGDQGEVQQPLGHLPWGLLHNARSWLLGPE